MSYDLNRLTFHIEWVLGKPTVPGWTDVRNNTGVHTFYWIHEGKGVFVTDQEHAVSGGTLAYMPPGLQMSMRSDAHFPLQMTMVLFDCAEVEYKPGWGGVTPIRELDLPFLRSFEPERAKKLGALFRHMHQAWVPGSSGGAVLSKSSLLAVMHEVHTNLERDGTAPDSGQQAYEKVKDHLENAYASEVKMESLAEQYGISVSYLRKMFQRSLGMSPKQYHSHIRNEHARRFLMYSELTIREIAEVCGYLEEYHFSKTFKKLNGMPPTRFREEHRKLETRVEI
ncbi:AraC family transcriptional regulator [Paenibacillus cremeus]|uniref:AraC family transcriptional regulator n=1 Tax=Paenibacillus cremeus TaxID=2163881 RepID=A0A559K3J0_9BACL|nr:AraC family transcriptional regulator [Paenibacillus cremeus]TVY06667.1 AraC family transcriptional regulator [Paenibacillus cremeus]